MVSLNEFLSPPRMTPYQVPGEPESSAVSRYQWNVRLAEALIPSLGYLEVGLRNGLNRVVSKIYGNVWLQCPIPRQLDLTSRDIDTINDIKKNFEERKGRVANNDDIVANLSFGFWISLLQRRHDSGIWHRGKAPLFDVFPMLPKVLQKKESIYIRLKEIKALRNRVAHHEPIWSPNVKASMIHASCVEIINAMSTEAAKSLDSIDRFNDVYSKGYLDSPQEELPL